MKIFRAVVRESAMHTKPTMNLEERSDVVLTLGHFRLVAAQPLGLSLLV
jgi:hypothetical protein